jgi:hypothetical protein
MFQKSQHLFTLLVFTSIFNINFSQNFINKEQVKILKTLKLEGSNAVHFREQADVEAPILGSIENNDKIEVIEELEDWLGIAISLQRNSMENGSFETKTNWEKVYVEKKHFANQLNLKLKTEDLNKISMLSYKEDVRYFNEIQTLDSLLKIELIDKDTFDKQKIGKIHNFAADTSQFIKKDGILSIKCKKTTITYKDNDVLNESIAIYNYMGQIPEINAFVIGCWYWEDFEYKLIDKKTGLELASTIEFPFLSDDKQKLISLYGNIYDLTGDLNFYTCKDKQISSKFSIKFSEWMPSYDLENIFWGSDGNLYLAVINKNSYWKQDGNLNEDFQFVKIKFN